MAVYPSRCTLNRVRVEDNLQWLDKVKQHAEAIGRGVNTPLRAERWGRKWASVSFEVPYDGEPDASVVRRCAELMKILIERTYSIEQARAGIRQARLADL
jgi:hypothetical protein